MSVPIPNSHITATARTLDPPQWNLWLLGDLGRRLWEFLRAVIATAIQAASSELMVTHKTIWQKKKKKKTWGWVSGKVLIACTILRDTVGFPGSPPMACYRKAKVTQGRGSSPIYFRTRPNITSASHAYPSHWQLRDVKCRRRLCDIADVESVPSTCTHIPGAVHIWRRGNPIRTHVLGGRHAKDEWGPFHLSWSLRCNPLAITEEVKIVKLKNVQLPELQVIYLIDRVGGRGAICIEQACGKVQCLWPCSHSKRHVCLILGEQGEKRGFFCYYLFHVEGKHSSLAAVTFLFFFCVCWKTGGPGGPANLSWP